MKEEYNSVSPFFILVNQELIHYEDNCFYNHFFKFFFIFAV